jgi:stage II sporulation protein D
MQLSIRRWSWSSLLLLPLLVFGACRDQSPLEPLRLAPEPVRADVSPHTFTGNIRIGVVPSATQLTIGADGDFVVRGKAEGSVLMSGSNESVLVEIEAPPQIETLYWLQVAYTTNQGFIDSWLEQAASYGYDTMLEQHPTLPGKRLLLGKLPATASFTERVVFRNEAIGRGLAWDDSFWRLISVAAEGRVRLTRGGEVLVADAPVVLESSARVRIGAPRYRGVAEVGFNGDGRLAGINELPMEEYLYGVVPRELPPVPYGELEAQKAQAVAARTYALANLGKRRADGYDLLPTTMDQVYGGYDAEHPVSSLAVDGTAGVVAVYGGRFAETLYHSTSGGFTANNEDVYNSVAVAYLRGLPDAERGQAFERVPSLEVFKRHANPINLRAAAGGDFEADWSRYHRWVVDWTAAEMATVLSASFGVAVTQVHEIRVTDRAEHGRVRRIEFDTDAGTLVGTKDQIRSRLRYIAPNGTHASLRSTLFYLEPTVDARTKHLTGWKAYGGGWGHGVGMSQTGAVGMAERGRSYQQILGHYYRGIELVQWY